MPPVVHQRVALAPLQQTPALASSRPDAGPEAGPSPPSADAELSLYPVGVVPAWLADLDDEPTDEVAVTVDDGAAPEPLTRPLTAEHLPVSDPLTSELQLSLLNRARQELVELDLIEAARTLERADALSPGHPVVAAHLAWLRLLCGQSFCAAYEAERALAAAPEDPLVIELVEALCDEVVDRLPF